MKRIVLFGLLLSLLLGGCVEKKDEQGRSLKNVQRQEVSANDSLESEVLKQLPPPAEGFAWAVFKGMAIQHPSHWHELIKDDIYYSSVEPIPENGKFETGLSMYKIEGGPDANLSLWEENLAKMIILIEASEGNTRLMLSSNDHEDVVTVVYRYRHAPKTGKPIIIHQYFQIGKVGNFENVITFQTTEEQWDEYWGKYGETMLGKVITYNYK